MRNAFIEQLEKECSINNKIILLSADIGAIVFDDFREKFPERFINTGVAENNMIGIAAGLALNGYIPVCYTIVPFITMRCFEHIRTTVCIQNLNVKLVGVGGGVSYSLLGPTHHSIEDIAIMRSLPNMNIISPADPLETKQCLTSSLNNNKPVYIRLGIAGEPDLLNKNYKFKFGKSKIIKKGNDISIAVTGCMLKAAIELSKILKQKNNINSEIINVSTIKPLDKKTLINTIKKTNKIITIEEHNIIGGLGSAVSEIIAETEFNKKIKFKRFGINDKYNFNYGSREYLYKVNGLLPNQIYKKIKELL